MATSQTKTKKAGYVYDLVTPKGRLLYPHLDTPNDQGQYPSGKYEVTLMFAKEGNEAKYQELMDQAVACAQQVYPELKADDLDISLRDGDEKKQAIQHGYWVIRAKSNREVQVFDGARNIIPATTVGHGDFGRISMTAGFYKKGVDAKIAAILRKGGATVVEEGGQHYQCGVTFYLNRVQRVEGNDGSIAPLGQGRGSEFPEEDEEF